MRVAYLVNHYPAISHSFIRREIAALEEAGVEVERFALRGWDEELVDPADLAELDRTRHTLRDGMPALALAALRCLAARPARFGAALKLALAMARGSVRSWPYHLVYLAHACRILGWIEGREVAHLHAHFGTNSAEIAALVHALGGPGYSFTIHGSEVFDDPKRHALPAKVEGARFVATSCAYIGSQLMYHLPPGLWPKVHVVPCGLPDAAFAAPPAPLPDHLAFLAVGRLSPEKGHLVLLEAFAEVLAAHPEARLVIAGDGPLRADLEARIAELGIGAAVRITGWVTAEEVGALIAAARALVHPSFTEGLPVVIMEAMAGHRPVISTWIAGIPELVRPGETGWLVPAGQAGDLAQAMLDCAEMPDAALRELGAAGHERARARHDVHLGAAKLKTLFSGGASA